MMSFDDTMILVGMAGGLLLLGVLVFVLCRIMAQAQARIRVIVFLASFLPFVLSSWFLTGEAKSAGLTALRYELATDTVLKGVADLVKAGRTDEALRQLDAYKAGTRVVAGPLTRLEVLEGIAETIVSEQETEDQALGDP